MRRRYAHLLVGLLAAALLAGGFSGCVFDEPEELDQIDQQVQPFLNAPGTRQDNQRNRLADDFLVQQLDEADDTVEAAIYGFSREKIVDAIIRAYDRGVDVRLVGDAQHLQYGTPAYERIVDRQIPLQAGNQYSIMHNKFFIIDGRFVFVGTGNITSTGFARNNNNWVYIDSVHVARDFRDEFEQMFSGRFGHAKQEIDNGERYQLGDTEVEVYFSPQEDAMGVILEETDKAHTNIFFQIFAFTKDEVGSRFIEKHREFTDKNEREADDGWQDDSPLEWPNKVVGLLDRSQLHGNGQHHEGYRMQAFGIPMRLDANENSRLPGDYQAGGGRLHTKTMILDYGTEDARVLTGSFNWSAAATISNDEVLLVLRGQRVVEHYMEGFREMWNMSRTVDGGLCYYMLGDEEGGSKPACAKDVGPQDVVISEVHWDGWNGERDPSDHSGARDDITNDEFVELYNPTSQPINLSMWTITNGEDFTVGFTPGTVIEPGEYFLVLDHNTEPYEEGEPQRGSHAFINPDFVLNTANDPRFPRLDLKNAPLELDLRDSTGEIIDRAGDGGTPFAGGRKNERGGVVNYSMERKIADDGSVQDGTKEGAWQSASGDRGGLNVHPDFRDIIVATPGEQNSR